MMDDIDLGEGVRMTHAEYARLLAWHSDKLGERVVAIHVHGGELILSCLGRAPAVSFTVIWQASADPCPREG